MATPQSIKLTELMPRSTNSICPPSRSALVGTERPERVTCRCASLWRSQAAGCIVQWRHAPYPNNGYRKPIWTYLHLLGANNSLRCLLLPHFLFRLENCSYQQTKRLRSAAGSRTVGRARRRRSPHCYPQSCRLPGAASSDPHNSHSPRPDSPTRIPDGMDCSHTMKNDRSCCVVVPATSSGGPIWIAFSMTSYSERIRGSLRKPK